MAERTGTRARVEQAMTIESKLEGVLEEFAEAALADALAVADAVYRLGCAIDVIGDGVTVLANEVELGERYERLRRQTGYEDLFDVLRVFVQWLDNGRLGHLGVLPAELREKYRRMPVAR